MKIKLHKPNPLPEKQDKARGRFPSFLHRKLPNVEEFAKTTNILNKASLPTVCQEAKCPNRFECYSKKTATFLTLGNQCTRACPFCDIDFSKAPLPPAQDEAERICSSISELGLKHVVLTMVARDDIELGGAKYVARILNTIKARHKVTLEILTSDFEGNPQAIHTVLNESPTIFNHNIETIERLTPKVRHRATYARSLKVLELAKLENKCRYIKSGLMVGLGEEPHEVESAIQDLKNVGVDIITIGQYLQPSHNKLKVKAFIEKATYERYLQFGKECGVYVYAGPFIRSSYNAAHLLNNLSQAI
jgi:lipoic acid synthetase